MGEYDTFSEAAQRASTAEMTNINAVLFFLFAPDEEPQVLRKDIACGDPRDALAEADAVVAELRHYYKVEIEVLFGHPSKWDSLRMPDAIRIPQEVGSDLYEAIRTLIGRHFENVPPGHWPWADLVAE